MLKKIAINNNYLLIATTVLFFFICYKLAFKKTFTAWQTNKKLKSELVISADLTVQPEYLERKNVNLDKAIAIYKADTTSLRSNLISEVSLLADQENVKLFQVPVQDANYNPENAVVEKLEFEGDFFFLNAIGQKISR